MHDLAVVMKMLGHPTRVAIIRELSETEEALSPNMLSETLGVGLGTCAYHVRTLKKAGVLQLVKTKPRRGAIEHFYRPVDGADDVVMAAIGLDGALKRARETVAGKV